MRALPPWSGTKPRGPKDQKNSRFRAGLKISSENEIFERATHHGPIFCGEIETSRLKFSSEIKNFDRDQKFRSGSNFFDRWALWEIQPKEEVFGRISLRTSGQKLRSGPPNPGKQAYWNGHPARTSMKKLWSKKLRADFPFPTWC